MECRIRAGEPFVPISPEVELRPEPDSLSPKENLEAIASILAVRRPALESPKWRFPERCRENREESPNMSGRRTCFPVRTERSCLTNASSRTMRGLPVNESGKGSPESSNGSRVSHSVLRQLATLETMSMDQLHERWRDLYGGEPPGYKRQFLIKRLAYRIQELFYGGLSEAVKTRLQQVAQDDSMARVDRRVSGNPRSQVDILPGTRFVRIWKDRIAMRSSPMRTASSTTAGCSAP